MQLANFKTGVKGRAIVNMATIGWSYITIKGKYYILCEILKF